MNEKISNLLQQRWIIPTAVGVASFAGGLGAGYILAKRRLIETIEIEEVTQLEFDFDDTVEVLEAEVDRFLRDHPSKRNDPRNITVVETVEEESEEEVYEEELPKIVNIFRKESTDDWDYEAELSTRTPDEPYIIHRDEFFNDEMGYGQSTLTFYNADNILTDEKDVPIYGHSKIVGPLLFGHGSEDPNVLYVRNEKFKHEYEILLSMGSYEVEVLGHQIEHDYESNDLKHSGNHRFKME